nr:hypothetical protein [Tanacetum cinerariifolium]
MADNLPKIVWYPAHRVTLMKSCLVQKQTALVLFAAVSFYCQYNGSAVCIKFMLSLTTAGCYLRNLVIEIVKVMLYSSQQMVLNSPCLTHKKELIHHEDTALSWLVQKEMTLAHHVTLMKSCLVQKQTALGQTATGKEISNPFMAGVNTPRSDEDRLELMELTVFLLPSDEKVGVEIYAVDLQDSAVRHMLLLEPKHLCVMYQTVLDHIYCQDVDVVLEDDKEVVDEAKEVAEDAKVDESVDIQGRQAESQAEIYKIDLDHANKILSMHEDATEAAEVQEVVDVVTTANLITEVVTAASETITAASTNITVAEA